MNKQQIDCFITLAQYRNFTDAAQRLYMSQPALSRQISGLEQELGCRLLNRNNKEVQITQAGEILLDFFKKSTQQFSDVLLEAQLTEHINKQNIRIGLLSSIELNEILDAIGDLQDNGRSNAIVLKRMTHSEIMVALHKGQLEAAVTASDSMFDENTMGMIDLFQSGFDLIISRKHYLAGNESITADDIRELMIAAQEGVIGTPREIYINTLYDLKRTFGETAIPKKIFTYSDLEDVIDFVESCSGAALIKPGTMYHIDYNRFVIIHMDIKRPFVFVWNKTKELPILDDLIKKVRNIYEA